jgi:6,7-dimethyl-8-ribityllumazine synthase
LVNKAGFFIHSMASRLKNLSDYDTSQVPTGHGRKFVIVVAEWNNKVTFALRDGAKKTLLKYGVQEKDILVLYVPGAFELTAACAWACRRRVDAVIAIGCVIKGDTPHFDYICQGVTQGITQLNLDSLIPVIFGVLTTNNLKQSLERAGGKHGNKGDEAAVTALKMIAVSKQIHR